LRPFPDRFAELSTGGLGAIAQDPMPAMSRVHLLSDFTEDVIDSLLDEFTNRSLADRVDPDPARQRRAQAGDGRRRAGRCHGGAVPTAARSRRLRMSPR
jgi:hypothetical protein